MSKTKDISRSASDISKAASPEGPPRKPGHAVRKWYDVLSRRRGSKWSNVCSVYSVKSPRAFKSTLCKAELSDVIVVGSSKARRGGASSGSNWLGPAVAEAVKSCQGKPAKWPHLVVTSPLGEEDRPAYRSLFHSIIDAGTAVLLPPEELVEALGDEDRSNLFVGAAYAPGTSTVVLYRGDFTSLAIPLSWFRARAEGPTPDPNQVRPIDYGQTVQLGEYEAAADAILYDFDREFRREAKRRQRHEDPSLGGSIRRLRLQRGFSQGDFEPGVSARTIGRVERGEVEPREETRSQIAEKLGVSVRELASY